MGIHIPLLLLNKNPAVCIARVFLHRNTIFLAEAIFHFMALSGAVITSGVLNFEGL